MIQQGSFSDEEILDKVKEIIATILMQDSTEIPSDASLVDELGLESIDFLDISFRLEETFGIAISRKNPIQRLAAAIGEDELLQQGKLTQKGVKLLRLSFPEVDPARIDEDMQEGEVPSLITARTYVNVVKHGLELARWRPDKCEKCGAADFIAGDKDKLDFTDNIVPLGPVFLCKSCEHMMIAPTFDELLHKEISD